MHMAITHAQDLDTHHHADACMCSHTGMQRPAGCTHCTLDSRIDTQEFIKYLFGYFDPPEAETSTKQPAPKVERAAKTVEELIPVYSSDGRLLRYIEQERVEEGPKTMEITQSTGKNLYDDDTGLIDSINPITVD
ncbi:hypothetical protein K443DRAFT_5169 [Laccaria amethystina LaAM-08-1]|uniref:Uncharacterized protein n=1 Tax=Laccaria amethystina LaAM-08-1 TaxID=1095629 RepID=A0A0C9WVT5_9AGAR|nr:hypothetical protein K443DRAFT_5169 [Laccaria amethystina LaAM-08-1]